MRAPDAPLRGELTVVRPATADDADLLVGWHADPEVARYWDGETTTRDQMLLELASPDVDPFVVQEDGDPVGYLQAWFDGGSPDEAGLDMFLIPGARGRGLGPDAARTLARWLLGTGRVRRLTVDPYLSNERAIRAWAKAGFRPVEEREPDHEHTSAWLLMVADGPAFGLPAEPGDASRPADERRPVVVHEIAPQDWERFRRIRLRALADSPFAFSSTVEEEEARAESDWRERLAHPGRVTFTAIDGDRWVGIAGVHVQDDEPSTVHLVSMWVDPGARRGGVGTVLVTRAIEWAQARGMRRLDLWVTETNEPAAPPLRRMRFRPRHPAPAPRLELRPDRGHHAPPASLSGLPTDPDHANGPGRRSLRGRRTNVSARTPSPRPPPR